MEVTAQSLEALAEQADVRTAPRTAQALAVGAVAERGSYESESVRAAQVEVAFFSSGASLVFPGQEPSLVTKPDLAAPGVRIWSCIPPNQRPEGLFEYAYSDGTSMATPHVAGVAALLLAAHPEAPVEEVARVLVDTARHPNRGGGRPDNRWGYGLVHPKDALAALD